MEDEPPKADQPPPRRRFQFRLRTLMIVVTLLAVPLGYVGWQAKIVREREDWLRNHSQAITLKVGKLWETADRSQSPGFLRRCLGDEEQRSIVIYDAQPREVEAAAELFPESNVLEFSH